MYDLVIEKIYFHFQKHTHSIISVCGLGGVGKTEFCRQLIAVMRIPCAYIQLDWYLIDSSLRRQEKIENIFAKHLEKDPNEYGNPYNWYDWAKFKNDLLKLKRASSLIIDNAWNQQTGNKDLKINITLQKNSVILCEGIYMFDPIVHDVTDLTILLETSSELAHIRAKDRDSHRSSRQYLEKKQKLAQLYEVPYMRQYRPMADFIINNSNYKNPEIIFAQ